MNEHSSIPPQPTDKTLNLEASLCLNGFKEAAFGVWRQKQAKHKSDEVFVSVWLVYVAIL